jgi:DNA-binding transcriptional LysR family regulator
MNNLRRIDVNLLIALHALLLEQHISRAALRLHKSQPAVSHALARLRSIFEDPLLIRRGNQLVLTPKARELLPPLEEALGQLEGLLAAPNFDPRSTQRQFRLAMSDYGAHVVLPRLLGKLRKEAPGISLCVTQGSREAMMAAVNDGEVDIALGVFPSLSSGALCHRLLFSETFACLADAATLPVAGKLSLEQWLARPHVAVTMPSVTEVEVDRELRRLGLKRQIQVTLPHWRIANDLVPGTDLILTVARRNLTQIKAPLRIFEPPFAIEPFDFLQVWHERREDDVAHGWLRQQIQQVAEPAEFSG